MATLRDPTRDIVRGLTSLEMTFVNISKLPFAAHAPYIAPTPGFTYADTIFPCFAFLAGMSATPPRRSTSLIGIGLSLNAVNAFLSSRELRVPGVLQRLGLSSLIVNEPRLAFLKEYAGLPLIGVWYAASILGSEIKNNPLGHPDFAGSDITKTAASRFDLAVFGSKYLHTPKFDPEGLIGALGTALSMVIGNIFISQRLSYSALQQVGGAASMIALGEVLHVSLPKYAPISKDLWSPSFVLVTSGTSILKYVAVEALVPYLPEGIRMVLEAVGRRSLEIYILSMLATMGLNYGGEGSLRSRGIRWFGQSFGSAGGDVVVCGSLVAAMAGSAVLLVKNRLRLSI